MMEGGGGGGGIARVLIVNKDVLLIANYKSNLLLVLYQACSVFSVVFSSPVTVISSLS